MASFTCPFKDIDEYSYLSKYPKFLAINKIWVCENSVDILTNTENNKHYLLRFEPGNYGFTFGQDYGFGDIMFKNLTGHVLNPYILDKLHLKSPGYLHFKASKNFWNTFAFATNEHCALWLDRNCYSPKIVLNKNAHVNCN